VADSGSQNLAFPAFLTSAMPPLAAVELIGWRQAANDPKWTFPTAQICPDEVKYPASQPVFYYT